MIRTLMAWGCAAVLALSIVAGAAAEADKVTICHHTGSGTNPYVVITIARSAFDMHLENHGHTGPDAEYVDGACVPGGGGGS